MRHCECCAETFEGLGGIAGGPAFEADDAGVAEAVQCGGNNWVVNFTGARLAAAGNVGDLDFADDRQGALDELDALR